MSLFWQIMHSSKKCISPKVQIQVPRNLVEMCFTKLSSRCKNLSFIWPLDCYQISIFPPLLHAKNCCTIADKIHSKTKASLIQFSWIFTASYTISLDHLHESNKFLITQTWLRSQLTQIFNIGQISTIELYFIKYESNLKSTCLNTVTRHKSTN